MGGKHVIVTVEPMFFGLITNFKHFPACPVLKFEPKTKIQESPLLNGIPRGAIYRVGCHKNSQTLCKTCSVATEQSI